MGRFSCYPAHGPRTSLIANREVRQAMRGNAAAAFGIRRMLDRESSNSVVKVAASLKNNEDDQILPAKLELRDDLSITLLSERVVRRQLTRGRIMGFHFMDAAHMLEQETGCQDRSQSAMVTMGDLKVHNGEVVYVEALSVQLEEEVFAIEGVMAELGLLSTSRKDIRVPHLTIGQTVPGQKLSFFEQDAIIDSLQPVLPDMVIAEPWESYPRNVFDSVAVA